MNRKKAFVTGITGQDGAYLSALLLDKNYDVYGLHRPSSTPNTARIDDILNDVYLMHGDMTDSSNIIRLINFIKPDEIYNLAAQSHVKISFDTPEYTANVDALGTLRLLEAIRILGLEKTTRFFQASSSELYGMVTTSPQNETTVFAPRSPYAAAKLYAYWITVNYRQAYGIHASNAIMFNHESPIRGEDFVTRKITRGVAAIHNGQQDQLILGNLNAKRDWGHARDYVEGMWRIVQEDIADDYVLATGNTHSVREFVELAFDFIGITIEWRGQGIDEQGINAANGDILVVVDKDLFRPTEVDLLHGDAKKAKDKLGWMPNTSFQDLIKEMMVKDLADL